jgi:large conductance mechanosensitive channel
MGMLKEFREFAMRGNVVDMAVGIIIGGAFGKIVTSMVNDVLMPPIGKLMGNVNFTDLFINLDSAKGPFTSLKAAKDAGAAVIAYGSFINTVIDFTIVAFCIFMMIKAMNTLRKKMEAPAPAPAAPTTKECPQCFSTIPIKAKRCPNCTSQIS